MSKKLGFFEKMKFAWLIVTQKYEVCVERCDICGSINIHKYKTEFTPDNVRSDEYRCNDCGGITIVKSDWRKKVK